MAVHKEWVKCITQHGLIQKKVVKQLLHFACGLIPNPNYAIFQNVVKLTTCPWLLQLQPLVVYNQVKKWFGILQTDLHSYHEISVIYIV